MDKAALRNDIYSLIQTIEALPGDREVLTAYDEATKLAYAEPHLFPKFVLLSVAAINYCLRRAAAAPDIAANLKNQAKIIAYNLGCNAWPGWGDYAWQMTPAELAIGREAAEFSLRLVEELDLGDEQLGNGHWLVGAQALAAGQHDAAAESFGKSRAAFERCGNQSGLLMAKGYYELNDSARNAFADDSALAAVLTRLGEQDGDDFSFVADQLVTAQKVFSKM